MSEIIGIFLGVNIITNFMWWVPCFEGAREFGLCFCNPKWIYNHTKTNWFGTTCLTILANVAFGPAALCYWFYKLCTVGRK
jgi:hypothetical protein